MKSRKGPKSTDAVKYLFTALHVYFTTTIWQYYVISSANWITWWQAEQKDIIQSTSSQSQYRWCKEHAFIIWMCSHKQHAASMHLQTNTTFRQSLEYVVDKQAYAEQKCKHDCNPVYNIHYLQTQIHRKKFTWTFIRSVIISTCIQRIFNGHLEIPMCNMRLLAREQFWPDAFPMLPMTHVDASRNLTRCAPARQSPPGQSVHIPHVHMHHCPQCWLACSCMAVSGWWEGAGACRVSNCSTPRWDWNGRDWGTVLI